MTNAKCQNALVQILRAQLILCIMMGINSADGAYEDVVVDDDGE